MNENRDIMLIDTSKTGITAIAPRNEIGMPIVTQNASRSRMNNASTTKTSTSPVIAFFTSRSMRLLSRRAVFCHVNTSIPRGADADARST